MSKKKHKDIVKALKERDVDGVEDVRAFRGFFMGDQSNNILEVKFGGRWMPLTNPVFKDRKEVISKVKEIKKAWRQQ